MSELYIGVMSGTSLDGIDISLCEIDDSRCKELHSAYYRYDAKIKEDVLKSIVSCVRLKSIGELNHALGRSYATAIQKFLTTNSLASSSIKAIGLHGQTLWHEPNSDTPFSMQLGDASLVSKLVGIDVVSDFRSADIAVGGQGAPLTPAFHKFMFDDAKRKTAVLNLGGIANITLLDDKLLGYDVGPANILLDAWIQKIKNKKYDSRGKWAKKGQVNEELLEVFLDEPYFKKPYPKTTGRELFNLDWLEEKLYGCMLIDVDVQATLVELGVISITNELKRFTIEELIVCGGGAKNDFFIKRLEESLPNVNVVLSDAKGVSGDSLEAMAFAWFAKKRVHNEVLDLKDVTGASKNTLLGAIYASD